MGTKGCTSGNVFFGLLSFLLAALCVAGLVIGPPFAAGGLGLYLVIHGTFIYLNKNKEDRTCLSRQYQRTFIATFWITLAILNALGALRFLFALQAMVLGQGGLNETSVDEIVECATGYVSPEPKCLDLVFPGGHFLAYDYGLYLHVAGAAPALFIGPFQLTKSYRQKNPLLHRYLGRLYALCIFVGTVGGVILAVHTVAGLVAAVGFLSLALIWPLTLLPALYHIRQAKLKAGEKGLNHEHLELHRHWMYRNYFGCTFAAVTLRLYLPILQLFTSFVVSYQIVAWISWCFNLIAVEFYIRWYLIPAAKPVAKTEENLDIEAS